MMTIFSETNSIVNHFIAQMRDVTVQKDSMRFRRNLERMGEVMAYEISKTLTYEPRDIETPLGVAEVCLATEKIVIATILRAGIPFHQGFLNYFDEAHNSFVSAYRKYSKDNTFNINIEYISSCDLEGKVLILVDPMLATGASLVMTYNALVEKCGKPSYTHIAAVVASEDGVAYVKRYMPKKSVSIWCGAVDAELTVKSYIVPGIGDAGDLAYGDKL